LQRVLRCILSDFGYVDPPPEGCPPRTGNMEEDRVAQITQHVIQALHERGMI